jgi:hypothetical protein
MLPHPKLLSSSLLILFAQCGDASLWQRTQAAFFERQRQRHPFLVILHGMTYLPETRYESFVLVTIDFCYFIFLLIKFVDH